MGSAGERDVSEGVGISPGPSARGSGARVDDFARLEERVVQLVERHREAQKLVRELQERVRASEQRVQVLESDLAKRDALREEVRGHLDRVIEWVAALESAAASAEASCAGAAVGSGVDGELEESRASVWARGVDR